MFVKENVTEKKGWAPTHEQYLVAAARWVQRLFCIPLDVVMLSFQKPVWFQNTYSFQSQMVWKHYGSRTVLFGTSNDS